MGDIVFVELDAVPTREDMEEVSLETILAARLVWEGQMNDLLGELADMASRADDKGADTISRAMAVIETATND